MAGRYDFACEQGATFSRVVTYQGSDGVAVNLTGYTARMQVRETAESGTILLDLTTENGGIALGGSAGTVTLTATATQTAAIAAGEWVYDIELVNGATVTRLLQGCFAVDAEVTR
jgi:hypothetical protein